jgi:mono/diheme cytochrome c family protein
MKFASVLVVFLLLQAATITPPRTWDEEALREWATPIAALNARPGHFSEAEYLRAPIDDLRTYPVYMPGREPAGYFEMIRTVGPKPIIEPNTLKTADDWVRAGQRVFREYDVPGFRVFDPKIIAAVRLAESFTGSNVSIREDGTFPDLRWVPTSKGLALGLINCAGCHTRKMPDGTFIDGPSGNENGSNLGKFNLAPWGSSPIELPGDSPALAVWRSWAAPWIPNDVHEPIKTMTPQQFGPLFGTGAALGLFPRWNGSGYYTTKIPDLIGFKDRKYIDHTATHQHRGPGDVMRYAALVTYSDSSDFGSYRMLTDAQRKIPVRASDAALYALAQYIYSLQPPPNPNLSDPRIATGQRLFQREGCAGCHTPPLYTNNKLTLAQGFTPPAEHRQLLDIMSISVGTDPSLAMKTRKGTGYYKVPSLKGVWYRGRYLHDGALRTLEEMFNPARVQDDFVPSGFMPLGQKTRAIKGHEFGLKLAEDERAALLAFLRSL